MKVNIEKSYGSGFRNITLFLFLLFTIIWASRYPQDFADFWGPVLANLLKAVYATLKIIFTAIVNILGSQSANR